MSSDTRKMKLSHSPKLAESNSQQHMIGHLRGRHFLLPGEFSSLPGNPERVLDTAFASPAHAPGEGALCSSSFAKLAAARGQTHSCLGVCSGLVGPAARFWSLGSRWYSCIGNDSFLGGLQMAKCVSMRMTICHSGVVRVVVRRLQRASIGS